MARTTPNSIVQRPWNYRNVAGEVRGEKHAKKITLNHLS